MKIVSINVGLPHEIRYRGKTVTTSIFKAPVSGRVRVSRLNVEGDRQSDLTVHGGFDKAVYVYPAEHYGFWRKELPDVALLWGAFGENFTTEGLLESTIHIGDTLRIGSAEFVVTQPRMPCFKLAIRFDRADMLKRFCRAAGRDSICACRRRARSARVTPPRSWHATTTPLRWPTSSRCTLLTAPTKICSVARAPSRLSPMAGGTIFGSGFGSPTLDRMRAVDPR